MNLKEQKKKKNIKRGEGKPTQARVPHCCYSSKSGNAQLSHGLEGINIIEIQRQL